MAGQHQARCTLRVQAADGSWRDCGVFAKKGGGAVQGEDTKYFPGGMAPQEAYPSQATVENVTLTGIQKLEKRELIRWLRGRTPKANAVVTEQPLDADGNASGPGDVWTGILLRVTTSDVDSSATGDPAEFEVEISTNGTIG
jgi:hypothetical protein